MGEQVVHFSDLTGQRVEEVQLLAQVNVIEHPDFEEGRRLEALPEELEALGKLAIKPVVLEVLRPDVEEPERFTLTVQNFGKLAVGRTMADVLEGAPLLQPKKRPNGNGETKDYGTLELCGNPHKGKTSPQEAELVRNNLAAVNERLKAQGLREIDPANAEHAKRYGLSS